MRGQYGSVCGITAVRVLGVQPLLDEDDAAADHRAHQRPHCYEPEVGRGPEPAERRQASSDYQHPLALTAGNFLVAQQLYMS